MNTPQESDFRDGMPFLGCRLWIDLVNSAPAALGDFLATDDGWHRWLQAAGLDAGAADALRPQALALRETLARLFECLRTGSRPKQADIERVNDLLAAGAPQPRLAWRGDTLVVEEHRPEGAGPLATIAADFADFAARHEPARLRHCANPECSLVFYDTARNGTRRWCSMAACGNRSKVRSHRLRASAVTEG
ncbi:CGNR zinc finger domain-containing protein [Xanthobacter flavus]|uniref:CGNR zinc finger domain-containing protein n=1 Tax=Xanthobacter flavus TaxID=281 RepID=UPI00372C5FA5